MLATTIVLSSMLVIGYYLMRADKSFHKKQKQKPQKITREDPKIRVFSVLFCGGNSISAYESISRIILERLSKEEIEKHWGESREEMQGRINLEFTSAKYVVDFMAQLTSFQVYHDAVEFGRVAIVESFSSLCELDPRVANVLVTNDCDVLERVYADEDVEMISARSLDRRFRLLKSWRERRERMK